MALRLMLLGTHYRAAINYTQRALEEASDRIYYIYQTLADADAVVAADPDALTGAVAPPAPAKGKKPAPPGPAEEALAAAATLHDAVVAALDDDLNTPQALAALSAPLKCANDLLTTKQGRKVRPFPNTRVERPQSRCAADSHTHFCFGGSSALPRHPVGAWPCAS